jgi:hypothetical protein
LAAIVAATIPRALFVEAYCSGGSKGRAHELSRRDPEEAPEGPGEVTLIGESQRGGSIGDGRAATAEHRLRTLDACAQDVPHRAFASPEPELPGEVEAADASECGEIFERDVLAEVGVDVRADSAERGPAQRARKAGIAVLPSVVARRQPQGERARQS